MKFSLKSLANYSRKNISPIFGESSDSTDGYEFCKAKRPNISSDKTELIVSFKQKAMNLAEIGELELAISNFDEAIKLSTQDSSVFEMKSQAHLALNQIFPAIMEAHRSVELSPNWGTAYQTLARAQLGRGEVELALRNIQKCLHLEPNNKEARKEDLPWCLELAKQKRMLDARVKFHSSRALEMSTEVGELEKAEIKEKCLNEN